ncbi:glycosyltransferase family 2 protein [Sediminibacterium ginsengisoli]|uniref:Glycosyltransferase involved in cell wall bisynthesis n=1 Tax=Sediminibacterium ginsengisoli TaxID=413434 RepID=A0A1T4JQG5_9BACT|nr:glycosyltransferase family 2 protein [Sediminibacterium ginsengisoli]SJZ32416.1 Glycosyltransferase involved in cell wall bisynthesis [Sediminibacterium ginsengisoli]
MNSTAPFISVIIPTYNAAATVARCLDSFVIQDYPNKEILVLDAFSTDETVVIVQSFSAVHDCIKLMVDKDKGIYDAMNKGGSLATGEWLYFSGSDDFLLADDVLTKVAKELASGEADVYYGDVRSARLGKHTGGVYGGPFDEVRILQTNVCHQAIFMRRSLFLSYGMYDIRYRYYADYVMNLKWMLDSSVRKKYIPVLIANYTDGGFSSTVPGDPLFFSNYASLVTELAAPFFENYPDKIKFLRVFFNRINRLDGPARTFEAARRFGQYGKAVFAALALSMLKYAGGFYFFKEKTNAKNQRLANTSS